jgi:hypothetical protein
MSAASSFMTRAASPDRPDAVLDRVLRRAVLTGLVLVLLVPLARASTEALGWLPLWLVGMPAVAWWALHRFRLPADLRVARAVLRRRSPQAKRVRARPA